MCRNADHKDDEFNSNLASQNWTVVKKNAYNPNFIVACCFSEMISFWESKSIFDFQGSNHEIKFLRKFWQLIARVEDLRFMSNM